jgi:predicted Fe-Mo cluster-binding NifX family protein
MEFIPSMKLAIPHWQGRVSPVFDVAGNLLVVETSPQAGPRRCETLLTAVDPLERARQVTQLGVDVLICGAISQALESALSSAGVRVIGDICGNLDEVVTAFQDGELPKATFMMPGCGGRRRRLRGGWRYGEAGHNRQKGSR